MRLRFLLCTLGIALLGALPAGAQTGELQYETYRLDNGLRVILAQDHSTPLVTVNVWYNVGSRNERNGRSGFAHLFEHLMFNGSENLPGDFFEYLQKIGATDYNGTTWFDRTNYFQTVPRGALDMGLFMESDRMGYLLGAVTQDKLDKQRGVVQNEKRQGDNQPYGLVDYKLGDALFPVGHPYRHSTIGSMDDLNAATIEDAIAFGDVIFISIPFGRIHELPVNGFAGKIVIDSNNYYPDRDGNFPELDNGEVTSSELLARHLGGARIVKAFNTIAVVRVSVFQFQ